MKAIKYASTRSGRELTRYSDGDAWTEEDDVLEIKRSNGKRVRADLENETVETKKTDDSPWVHVGMLIEVFEL